MTHPIKRRNYRTFEEKKNYRAFEEEKNSREEEKNYRTFKKDIASANMQNNYIIRDSKEDKKQQKLMSVIIENVDKKEKELSSTKKG